LDNKSYLNLKREFIKSAATLILALILLVTAVVAWFSISTITKVSNFVLSVQTEDGGIYLADTVAVKSSFVLPCATKHEDDTISANDLSQAIHVETFDIMISSDVKKFTVSVTPSEDSKNLHFYIDGNYTNIDSVSSLATEIKEFPEDVDADMTYTTSNQQATEGYYKRTVAVVFWAEYNDETEAELMVEEISKLEFSALVEFSDDE